ncbi:MAG TPA: NAD(P)H-dependent oxidoreductase [Sphingopyxis sp.]|jgi:multimeric flavodoxin WrbA|uniref:flavodoxin family protein n=1 Tax=unclassified Sphingopyxis TaxID=2614943 RepID=UPI0009790B11|nr:MULTISPECIES: NAD(P)H-dependent oxidoreductase [unclassified Sphingopyxis]APZ97478.1 NADPH-dependent oxidoreductase [Sphingopyxis sp. QXT-31]MBN8843845.1 NAD(P)H-dependent oxidoreductase [Sphingomonadales bacterium]HWW57871.1 NAD(P)H-dependent oxidoreductase [Sphingopyxis sp.]
MPPITATAINCSLSARGRKSSTDAMLAVLTEHFEAEGVRVGKPIRIAAHSIKWGVTSNEGAGDEWPKIREAILASDILIFGTPIWMGQASSVAKLVMERMDAFLSETDDKGRMPSFSKVAVAAIVGNEDGAHNASSQIFQALNDVGWTIPAVAACYWVGEAMGSVDFKDLQHRPSKVTETAKMVAANATHLARLLRESPYPG